MGLMIYIGRGKTFYDVSQLLSKVTWSGRKGAAPRSIEAVFFDSEQLKNRVPSDVGEGQTVLLYEVTGSGTSQKTKELFQGLLMSERIGNNRQLTIKAYDVCIRFTNNTDSFSYKNKRADEIVKDCCKRLGIDTGTIQNTGHKIGELVKKATTYWDVIEDALSQTYSTKGKRYYVYAENGRVHLKERKETEYKKVIESGSNVESYSRTRSIENTRTRLKLVTSKGKNKGSTVIEDLEKKIGRFQEMQSVDEKITRTEVKQRVNAFKTEQGVIGHELRITATGDSDIKTGSCVYVKIPSHNINDILFVEEDSHTWSNGKYTMSLRLDE